MLDLVKMDAAMSVLIEENRMIDGLASQRRYIISCENEVLFGIRSLMEATEELESSSGVYAQIPNPDNMWEFKRCLDAVVEKKKRLEFHVQTKEAAKAELEELKAKHDSFLPQFFAAQTYLCMGCVY